MGDRKSLTLAHGMEGILENTFLNVKNTSKTIEADVTLEGKGQASFFARAGSLVVGRSGSRTFRTYWLQAA